MDLCWLINIFCMPFSAKTRKKSNKIDTAKIKKFSYLKCVQKYFGNFTMQHIPISQHPWKFLKWNYFFKLFFFTLFKKKLQKNCFLGARSVQNIEGGTGSPSLPLYTLSVFYGEQIFQTKIYFSTFCKILVSIGRIQLLSYATSW